MSRQMLWIAAAAAALIATPLVAQMTPMAGKVSAGGQTFVDKAANGGMFEIESSKIALEKAKRSDVKIFASKMVTDHTKAGEALDKVAGEVGATVPKALDKLHQGKLDKLKSTAAPQFDAAFIDAQAEGHRDAVALFTEQSKTGDVAQLKAFATETLPTLQAHDADVKKLQQGESASTGASSGTSSDAHDTKH